MLASEETYMANAERGNKFVGWMTKMTLSRQRTWENRDALVRFLRNTPPWSAWEVRALNQYIVTLSPFHPSPNAAHSSPLV